MNKSVSIFILFLVVVTILYPKNVWGSVLDEGLPVVHINQQNEEDYYISKTISKDKVIVYMKEKKTSLVYSWSFDKNKITNVINLDFKIDFTSPKKEEIDSLTGDIDKFYISFLHHGSLPSTAMIRIDVKKQYQDGEKLYLYYFNEEKKHMEFIDKDIEVKDGYVEFEIDHCSDYILTTTIVNDAVNNPKSMNYIIVGLVTVIIILIGITMFTKKN